MNREQMCILYVDTIEIRALDLPRALDEIGFDVYRASLNISAQGYDKKSCHIIVDIIRKQKIQYVISYYFSESIAQACFETGIPYISWVHDAPQKELYTHYALYPCNYVFVFDKKQKERLRQIGIKNVYYMPLAIMPNKVKLVLEKKEEEKAEIAFVGRLYKVDNLDSVIGRAEEKVSRLIEENIENCLLRWDKNITIHGKMDEECVKYFSSINKEKIKNIYPYMSEQFYYEAAVTSRLAANRERVTILNTLAEKYNMKFYTDSEGVEELSSKVKIMPPVQSDKVSQIYFNSKININITLHCIESGIPQRVFDVMAAGGFMLSNYQKELEELFVPGDDIVLYHNLQELEELVEYYLTHEDERRRIAENGQKKVMMYHDLHDRMRTVMEFVVKKEITRTKPYSILQKEGFYEQIDALLAEGKDSSYEKIYHLLQSLEYAEDVPKAEELSWIYEMLNCWKVEMENGKSNIFCDVSSLKGAERKYFQIKHGVWRIESELSEEKCRETVCRMCKNRDSMLLAAWIIKKHVQEQERVYLAMAEYMKDYNMINAVRLLFYGVMYFPQNEKLVKKQLEYLNILKEIKEKL